MYSTPLAVSGTSVPCAWPWNRAKSADDRGARRHRQIDRKSDQETERHDRGEDAGLDEGDRHMRHAERAADQHHADERRGPHPEGAPALQRRPQAHGDHHRHVVEAGERMTECPRRNRRCPRADVGEGGRGGEEEQGTGAMRFMECPQRMGLWTVTSLVPSGNVAST